MLIGCLPMTALECFPFFFWWISSFTCYQKILMLRSKQHNTMVKKNCFTRCRTLCAPICVKNKEWGRDTFRLSRRIYKKLGIVVLFGMMTREQNIGVEKNDYLPFMDFPGGKESTCQCSRHSSILRSGKSPGVGNGDVLQNSCLGNSMDRAAWQATVHAVSKSWTWLSAHTHRPPIYGSWFIFY